MEPEIRTQKGAVDGAPETVTGWFIGSVVGYRVTVGWMLATLAQGTVALWAIFALANEVRLLRLLLEAK